jgi:hypothetical protein
MGDREIFLKTSAQISLIKALRMNLFWPDPSRWTVPLSRKGIGKKRKETRKEKDDGKKEQKRIVSLNY